MIPKELQKIIKSTRQKLDGPAGTCFIYSISDVKDRIKYHTSQNTVDPNFIFFSILSFNNTPQSAKLLPSFFFDDQKGLAAGSSLYYFFNTDTGKIAQFFMPEKEGSGYTRGFKWKPKDINYVSTDTFIPYMKKLTKFGTKKKFYESITTRYLNSLFEAEGWQGTPKGWTGKSIKKYAKSLTGKKGPQKGFFDKCVERMRGKMDNPEAYCASIKDETTGSTYWRGKGKSPQQAGKDVKKHQNVRQEIRLLYEFEKIEEGDTLKCNVCGRIVHVKEAGRGPLICCNLPMEVL